MGNLWKILWRPVASIEIVFNMSRQRPAELLFDRARKRNVAVLARVPLASGLLTGKLHASSQFSADDRQAFNQHGEAFDVSETFAGVPFEVGLQAVEALRRLVPPHASLVQLASRWILMFDAVTTVIPGTKNRQQAGQNAAAADLPPLTGGQMAAVQQAYDGYIRRPELLHDSRTFQLGHGEPGGSKLKNACAAARGLQTVEPQGSVQDMSVGERCEFEAARRPTIDLVSAFRQPARDAGASRRIGGTRQRGTVLAHTAACPAGRVRRAWPGTVPQPGKRRECETAMMRDFIRS
jgi:hypothetical protein